MKKGIFLILMVLVIAQVVIAVPKLTETTSKEIKAKAFELEGNSIKESAYRVDNYVQTVIKYKFYWYARGNTYTWYYKEGDCTDKARLSMTMLEHLGIETRFKHGFVKWYGKWALHDWYEFQDSDGTWINPESYEKVWLLWKSGGKE